MGVSLAAMLAVTTVLSCASSPPQEPNMSGTKEAGARSDGDKTAVSEPGSAYDKAAADATANTCADRPCFSNSDCCSGASCGYDPERSHVQRYCL
jgi:hypothetical protein